MFWFLDTKTELLKQLMLIAIVSTILGFGLLGCGPKVFLAPVEKVRLRTVILLPPSYKSEVAREKVDHIHATFKNALVAKGFNIDSTHLVDAPDCSDSFCHLPASISSNSEFDVVASIAISGTTSANLFAGHYESISGWATFYNTLGATVAKVEHTESVRGGLLFNSGQVLQGIESTVDSLQDDAFAVLAGKFVDTLTRKLPAPKGSLQIEALNIGKTSMTSLGNGRYFACIESSNAIGASLSFGSRRIELRKAEPGKFCARFLLDPENNQVPLVANFIGRFGESKQVVLEDAVMSRCATDKVIRYTSSKVSLSDTNSECTDYNFLVYLAPDRSGPYTLAGKLARKENTLILSSPSSKVVAVVGTSDKIGNSKTLLFK